MSRRGGSRVGKRLARLTRTPELEAGAGPSAPAGPSGERLQSLRAKLAAQLGGAAPARRASLEPVALALDTLSTEAGMLHLRIEQHPPDARVGAYALRSAASACATTLSLLALTPELASCRPERALFLDTETTGFGNGTGNVAFLVGMSWHEPTSGGSMLEQLFLRSPNDERALLERVRARLEWADCVVSYNGKSFDMPVLRGRCVMNRLAPLPERPQLDLLHLARRVHRHRSWPKKLGRLEAEVLGFRRGDDVEGQEVAERYLHYLRSGDESGLDEVMTHNARDVLSLTALTGLYGEPLELPPSELASMARVVRRAGDLQRAKELAELAVERGAGVTGLRARAEIAKARGDKRQALRDFEALAEQVGDADVRLELAKLYEHFLKQPGRALSVVEKGTGECSAAWEHRRARLTRKLDADAERAGVADRAP